MTAKDAREREGKTPHEATLYFIERASSDNARIRAINDAWAKAGATER
jgi:hypothetical protein